MLNQVWKMVTGSSGGRRLALVLALIAAATVAVYWPVLHNGFIDFDDPDYVTLNMVVRQGLTLPGALWAFTAFHAGNWHPVTWLSHMTDVQLFGLDPAGHHAVSLLLHVANALLLCHLLYRLTGVLGRSALVAALFALHPLHVESVAWVAERKDVLSTLFWLLTMEAYVGYAGKRSLPRYLSVVLPFVVGLMAKQMLVTLPLVLLLLDFWPLGRFTKRGEAGRIWSLLWEKVPLLLLAAAASLVTLSSQSAAGALAGRSAPSALLCAGNALITYVRYLGKMLWPADLAIFYPLDPAAVTFPAVAASLAFLAAVTIIVLRQAEGRPYLAFGWLWYLVTLLPVIGFIKVGSQAMADRYTYVPLIGIFVMIVWGGAEIAGRWRYGLKAAGAGAVVVLLLLGGVTVSQLWWWRTSYDLFSHALAVVPDNWLAHNNMGILLAQQYRMEEAIGHFRESLRIYPNQAEGYRNLGNAYQSVGNNGAAIDAFLEAVRMAPDDADGHFRLGYAYLAAGNLDGAYRECRQLERLNPSAARSLLDSIGMIGGRR